MGIDARGGREDAGMGPRSILVAVVAITLLSACVPEGSELPAPTPETPPATSETTVAPPTTATASPTPTPSLSTTVIQSFPPPPADETAEEAAIREGWMNYWKVYDKFTANPYVTDFTETQLVTVSGSDQARIILDVIQRLREEGWKVNGDHILRDYKIVERPSVLQGVRTVAVTYCYDGRQKRVVDAATGAEAATNAADTYKETAQLEEGADGIWRISLIGNEVAVC